MVSGQKISCEFKRAGLKAKRTESTIIHGYTKSTKGDYQMYTEKSFGLYGLPKHKRARHIRFESSELLEKGKRILTDLNVQILQEYPLEIITSIV